ncbi:MULTISPECIES: PIG-L deacetylase family protein [unclassified Streptomyces]|uniref:PIG-L deacetylase family protein n=1 Tax=unclassified Streptomyces TaxID=2593676 RepID=UPI0037B85853
MVRVLAVSPHLDDAVVSYGARLHQLAGNGAQVVVLTLFAGTPSPPYSAAAQRYHDVWGVTGNPVPQRIREDVDALRALGLTPRHADFLDALYRRLPDGRWLVADPSRSVSRQALEVEEPDLMASLEARIGDVAADYRPDAVFTCAAIGRHVDHWRARDATVGALAATGVELRLWEDLPYGGRASEMPPLPAGVFLTERVVEQVDSVDRDAKFTAIEHYVSQLDLLARDGVSLRDRLSRHAGTRSRTAYSEATWGLTAAEPTK